MKKKILHIVNENALRGGIGTVIKYLNEGLNEQDDFSSDTLLTSYKKRKIGHTPEGHVKHQFLPKDSLLEIHGKKGNILSTEKHKHSELEDKLSEYDVIHVHGIPHYGILENLYKIKEKRTSGRVGPKIINTAHSDVKKELVFHYENIKNKAKKGDPKAKIEEESLRYYLNQNILNDPSRFGETYWGSAISRQEKIMTLADSVQHMNNLYKEQIIESYSAQENKDKHFTLPNGVKVINADSKRPKKKRMLFVGRFAKEKGIDELTDAIPYLLEKHPDAEMRFVGGDRQGKQVKKYKKKIEDNIKKHFKHFSSKKLEGILKNVHFTGWIDDVDELKKQYEWTDYVVIPSASESFSLTASEALMYGRIPVMTATPALKDLYIDKGIGLGINPEERHGEGIAKTLGKILENDDSEKYDKIVKKGREFVIKNYSFDNMIKKQKDAYLNLVS